MGVGIHQHEFSLTNIVFAFVLVIVVIAVIATGLQVKAIMPELAALRPWFRFSKREKFPGDESILMFPLYMLFHVYDISGRPYTLEQMWQIIGGGDQARVERIVSALEWVCEHPEYPAESLLQGLRFSHEQVHGYLMRLLENYKCRETD